MFDFLQRRARRSCALAMAIDTRRSGDDAADLLIVADMFDAFLAGKSEWTRGDFIARRSFDGDQRNCERPADKRTDWSA